MTEASLTQDLMLESRQLMPGSVTLKISARFNNAGYPDLTHTWHRFTSWWEIKFFNDEAFESPELQHTTCRRLAHAGICLYVIYERRKSVKRTIVAHPDFLDNWVEAPLFCNDFNHRWVSQHMAYLHLHPERFNETYRR